MANIKFQSTPLREGRHAHFSYDPLTIGFNPRPCVRGDGSLTFPSGTDFVVSIHAPA